MFAGFDLGLVWKSAPDLLHGLAVTLQLTVLTVLGGILLSIPLGILRASRHRLASSAIWLYTYFFRGTPMLIQLYLIYYGLGQFAAIRDSLVWPVLSQAYWCCLLTFTLNTAAYTIEIVAGAIRNVPHADIETAHAHGMSHWTCLRRITLPVAFRIVLPAYTNEVIFILQSSSLASIVTVLDLTGVARTLIARTFASYEFYITIGLIYLALTYLMLWGFRRIERRWYRHLERMPMASRDAELALR